jgi:hypothetical protein
MTAMLRDLRDLDSRFDRGLMTDAEYKLQRAALLNSVDDASPDFVPARPPKPRRPRRRGGSFLWGLGTVVCMVVIGASLILSELLFADLNLALTLGVTVLAALTIALLRSLEE